MSYIWQNHNFDKKFKIASANDISPYMEILADNSELCSVNPSLRFGSIFYHIPTVSKNLNWNSIKIENILFHLLACIDRNNGLNRCLVFMNELEKDIENGFYGDFIKESFVFLNNTDKHAILYYLYLREKNNWDESFFFYVLQRVFNSVSIIFEKHNDIYYLCLGMKPDDKNKLKLDIIKYLFWDIQNKLEVIWEKHIGIIGEDNHMYIDNIYIV